MGQARGMPVAILKEGTQRTRGKDARESNIMAARAIAEAVRSTLGPKGMDKMLVDGTGNVTITNDGKVILDEIDVEHPAAKMVAEIAKTVDNEVGDGTTTAVVLAGGLLKQAKSLLDQNIHGTTLVMGYRMAAERAIGVLEDISVPVSVEEEEVLENIAMTAMTGRGVEAEKGKLADFAVRAVRRVLDMKDGKITADIDKIKIEKKEGGGLADSELVDGVIVDKERAHPGMPKCIKNSKIALLDCELEVRKTETDAKIHVTDPKKLKAFFDAEEATLREMVNKIIATGANVVFCQKGIGDFAQHCLMKSGLFAVKRVKKSDMEQLARATGGKISTNIEDLSKEDLGFAGLVEERKIADKEMVFVEQCRDPKAISILLRSGTEHAVDEAERALHDAICVVSTAIEDKKIVCGGGAAEVELARNLRNYAKNVGGREALAINAFADAVEVIPRTLAENVGVNQIDSLVNLKARHEKGEKSVGLDPSGELRDMIKTGVLEPLRTKKQVIKSASEAAGMILRIDDIILAKGTEKKGPPRAPAAKLGG